MPLERSFLAAIAADRDNDGLRLVYADWLEELGDPRCQYLRAMCRVLDLPPFNSEERKQLVREVEAYYAEGDREWALAVARRIDVMLHTVEQPLHLMELLVEVQRLARLTTYAAIDLVRGMPNTGRFRSDPRRVVQVATTEAALDIARRLRERGASVTVSPATALVECPREQPFAP